jgi:hypothetical protein
MLRITTLVLLVVGLSGCAATRLRDRIVNQTETLTDLQYKQVLGNLARLHIDPYALPSQSNLHDGTAQVQANAAANLALWRTSQLPSTLSGSRTIVEQWTVRPVTDDTVLKLLRLTYQRALGMPVSLVTEGGLANDVAHELKKQIAWPESPPAYTPGERAMVTPGQGRVTQPFVQGPISQTYPLYPPTAPAGRGRFETPTSSGPNVVPPPPGRDGGGPAAPIPPEPNPRSAEPAGADRGAARSSSRSKKDDGVRLAQQGIDLRGRLEAPPGLSIGRLLPEPIRSKDQEIEEDIANSMHVIKLSEDYFSAKFKTSNSEDIISDEELADVEAFQPGASTEKDGVISAGAREVRRQVKELEKDLRKIKPGWVHFGCKPPHDACYVGRYGKTFAWVYAKDGRQLADFTLIVLNFSDLIKEQTVMTSPGGVRFSPSPTR